MPLKRNLRDVHREQTVRGLPTSEEGHLWLSISTNLFMCYNGCQDWRLLCTCFSTWKLVRHIKTRSFITRWANMYIQMRTAHRNGGEKWKECYWEAQKLLLQANQSRVHTGCALKGRLLKLNEITRIKSRTPLRKPLTAVLRNSRSRNVFRNSFSLLRVNKDEKTFSIQFSAWGLAPHNKSLIVF